MGMNANTIINDEMTLEEKLAAIDAAMQAAQSAQVQSDGDDATDANSAVAPVDPASLFMCEGCQ